MDSFSFPNGATLYLHPLLSGEQIAFSSWARGRISDATEETGTVAERVRNAQAMALAGMVPSSGAEH